MKEVDYAKLKAEQKKAVDAALRATPRTLDNVKKVTTSAPQPEGTGKVVMTITVQFDRPWTGAERQKMAKWWGLSPAAA